MLVCNKRKWNNVRINPFSLFSLISLFNHSRSFIFRLSLFFLHLMFTCFFCLQVVSRRTSPSWLWSRPSRACRPSSSPSTASRASSSWASSSVAPPSSCTRTRTANRPPRTTRCSEASTWPMASQ